MPVITSAAGVSAIEDIEYTYQISVVDPDHDSFTYVLTDAPEGMEVSNVGLITWTPLEGVLSSGLVTLTVSDGDLTAEEMFEISVQAVNDTPVILSVAPTSATEDIQYSYQLDIEDPDNDSFVFTLTDDHQGISIYNAGHIT